jgi:hypothetical protein
MTTYSLFDLDLLKNNLTPMFSLNQFNYSQQADILIPKAVDYSAGLLNHFFRGSMAVQGDSSGFTITNTTMNGATPEDMNGTFILYYDDQTGNRQPVNGAIWTLSIPGGMTSASLSFTAPTSPAPANSGQYTLVFQGTLGDETGAVAGTQVQLGGGATLSVVKYVACGSSIDNATIVSQSLGLNCTVGVGQTGPIIQHPENLPRSCRATVPTGSIVSFTIVPSTGFLNWNCFDSAGNLTSTTTDPTVTGPLNGDRICVASPLTFAPGSCL